MKQEASHFLVSNQTIKLQSPKKYGIGTKTKRPMQRTENPEIDPNIYNQLIFEREDKNTLKKTQSLQ